MVNESVEVGQAAVGTVHLVFNSWDSVSALTVVLSCSECIILKDCFQWYDGYLSFLGSCGDFSESIHRSLSL